MQRAFAVHAAYHLALHLLQLGLTIVVDYPISDPHPAKHVALHQRRR